MIYSNWVLTLVYSNSYLYGRQLASTLVLEYVPKIKEEHIILTSKIMKGKCTQIAGQCYTLMSKQLNCMCNTISGNYVVPAFHYDIISSHSCSLYSFTIHDWLVFNATLNTIVLFCGGQFIIGGGSLSAYRESQWPLQLSAPSCVWIELTNSVFTG